LGGQKTWRKERENPGKKWVLESTPKRRVSGRAGIGVHGFEREKKGEVAIRGSETSRGRKRQGLLPHLEEGAGVEERNVIVGGRERVSGNYKTLTRSSKSGSSVLLEYALAGMVDFRLTGGKAAAAAGL